MEVINVLDKDDPLNDVEIIPISKGMTKDIELEIVADFNFGLSYAKIYQKYNIGGSTMSYLINKYNLSKRHDNPVNVNLLNKTKLCPKCHTWRSFDDFAHNPGRKYNLSSWCNSCVHNYAVAHKDELISYHKNYRELNRQSIRYKLKAYYDTHKEWYEKRTKKQTSSSLAPIYSFHNKPVGYCFNINNLEYSDCHIGEIPSIILQKHFINGGHNDASKILGQRNIDRMIANGEFPIMIGDKIVVKDYSELLILCPNCNIFQDFISGFRNINGRSSTYRIYALKHIANILKIPLSCMNCYTSKLEILTLAHLKGGGNITRRKRITEFIEIRDGKRDIDIINGFYGIQCDNCQWIDKFKYKQFNTEEYLNKTGQTDRKKFLYQLPLRDIFQEVEVIDLSYDTMKNEDDLGEN